ncbi:glycosyltransferase [Bacillus salipaludis]|uniref:glycosyltransferase n=1 Tax=Bacillus salipaludis TaxID=2547811 RepID=UPI002E23DD63|nr:glycosyltransferase [Bacillus salipaludis]
MSRIKLLVIIRDFSKWVDPEHYYLTKEMSNITDIVFWHQPGNIHDILKQIEFVPDFILIFFYASDPGISPPISGLDTLEIPFGVYLQDLHNLNDVEQNILKDNVKHIFASYRDYFYKNFPNLVDRMKWLPHSVNINIFKDYGLNEKDIKMLMMGAVIEYYYPLRYKILQTFSNHPDFVYHQHPGYRDIDYGHEFVREKYAFEINRAQLFLTCDSIYKYPLLKYMEVLACNTLLLAPESPELYDLGFRSEENFVAINENNFVEKVQYYLNNPEERKRIAKNGYNLVRNRHTTKIRAKELESMIRGILES